MSSGDIFVFIFGVWLAIVVIAWSVDNGSDIVARRKARKETKRKVEQQEHVNRISLLIEKAKLHRDVEAMNYHRSRGSHRLVRVR